MPRLQRLVDITHIGANEYDRRHESDSYEEEYSRRTYSRTTKHMHSILLISKEGLLKSIQHLDSSFVKLFAGRSYIEPDPRRWSSLANQAAEEAAALAAGDDGAHSALAATKRRHMLRDALHVDTESMLPCTLAQFTAAQKFHQEQVIASASRWRQDVLSHTVDELQVCDTFTNDYVTTCFFALFTSVFSTYLSLSLSFFLSFSPLSLSLSPSLSLSDPHRPSSLFLFPVSLSLTHSPALSFSHSYSLPPVLHDSTSTISS